MRVRRWRRCWRVVVAVEVGGDAGPEVLGACRLLIWKCKGVFGLGRPRCFWWVFVLTSRLTVWSGAVVTVAAAAAAAGASLPDAFCFGPSIVARVPPDHTLGTVCSL